LRRRGWADHKKAPVHQMSKTLISAIVFSVFYLVELLVFGIGAFKEGGGRGFSYCFLAVVLVLWVGFFSIRKREFRHKTASFVGFALALSLWMKLAWRIELAVEEHEDRETIAILRRIEVLDVTDQPLLTSQGTPLGIRMRYSVQFPRAGLYFPAPTLTAIDERFQARSMRIIRAEILPRPEEMRSDASNTGTYARYKGNVTYSFVVDLVPGFVIISPDKTKSCLSFLNAGERNAVAMSDDTTRFRVHIDGTDYGGYFGGAPQFTKNAYSVRDFYQDAVANGAKDTCGFDSRGEMQ
jgi:hypothetical protein